MKHAFGIVDRVTLDSIDDVVRVGEAGCRELVDGHRATAARAARDQEDVPWLRDLPDLRNERRVHLRTVCELAVLSLVAHEGQRNIPRHFGVADERELFGGSNVDDLHLVGRSLPHLVRLRGRHVQPKRGLLHLRELAAHHCRPLIAIQRHDEAPSCLSLRHVVGTDVLAVAAALVRVAELVANDRGPPARRPGVKREVLGEHLGLELPALRQVLQLAAHRLKVVRGQARIDSLGVLLQDPDRAARVAQQMHGLSRVKDPVGVALDQRGHISALELRDHLGAGHVPGPIHFDAVKVDAVAAGVLHFVHHPEAAAVDRALVDFELTRQLLRIDLLVVVRTHRKGRRRIDVSPLSLADADKGAESAERGAAGVVGMDSASRTWS